jgi:hypothetical protein
MAEDYIRPPLVATEPPSPAAARWRFRITLGAVFLVLIALLVLLLFTVLLANNEGNPGLNPQGLPPAAYAAVTTAAVTAGA